MELADMRKIQTDMDYQQAAILRTLAKASGPTSITRLPGSLRGNARIPSRSLSLQTLLQKGFIQQYSTVSPPYQKRRPPGTAYRVHIVGQGYPQFRITETGRAALACWDAMSTRNRIRKTI